MNRFLRAYKAVKADKILTLDQRVELFETYKGEGAKQAFILLRKMLMGYNRTMQLYTHTINEKLDELMAWCNDRLAKAFSVDDHRADA